MNHANAATEGDLSTDIAGLPDAKAGRGISAPGMVFCPVGGRRDCDLAIDDSVQHDRRDGFLVPGYPRHDGMACTINDLVNLGRF